MSYIWLSYFPDIMEIPLVFYLSVISITAKKCQRYRITPFYMDLVTILLNISLQSYVKQMRKNICIRIS